MSDGSLHRFTAALLLAALAACAPSLNWREVRLGRLTTLLPCKPDSGSRKVVLAEQALSMDMAGCEVSGAMFTISRIQAADATQAAALLVALRQASLDSVQVQAVHPLPNSGNAQTSFDLRVDGKRPDGKPLQSHLKWLMAEGEVYQIAVYAERVQEEETENIFKEARIR